MIKYIALLRGINVGGKNKIDMKRLKAAFDQAGFVDVKTYTNNGLEYYAHYYRDIDSKEVDLVLESDGELHPIEIKKTASPSTELVNAFKVLDKASVPRGTGAVICTRKELSAFDKGTMIVPVWAI
jgi:predicted AAA+ superfamily ATPase